MRSPSMSAGPARRTISIYVAGFFRYSCAVMWKKTNLFLFLFCTAVALSACDGGGGSDSLACEDLDRVDYSDSLETTPEQQRAVDDYLSMAGRYTADLECMDAEVVAVTVEIRNVSVLNVEFFVIPPDQDVSCADLGTTSFEMTVENSGDPDLEGHDFFMSGRFPDNENSSAADWAISTVEAQSDPFASAQEGIAQYRMKLHMDNAGDLAGTKNVITESVTLGSGTVTTSQRDECKLHLFSRIAAP